ncbi:MAG: hypothetical protein KC613_03900 [Myxococcales bacterium]|nr:hypothetical protein [Myxococcales bacterium]
MRRAALGLTLALAACDSEGPAVDAGAPPDGGALGAEAALDPALCQDCHPDHYRQWSGSMHAYASEDPVFRALEAKGQRETGGALGDFCVQCHAPVAHRLGRVSRGADLDGLPAHLKGITCAWCHQIEAVHGDRNNPLAWANDGVMRGGIADPSPTSPHRSAYSPLLDRDTETESSALCGACHDIGLPHNGLPLEKTWAEWQGSLFSDPDRLRFNSCGHCHMKGRDGQAALDGPPRRVHDHAMVGVDVALTEWPERADQRQRIQRALDTTLVVEICVVERRGGAEVEYYLENIGAGHHFPSGAALDRRAWVELEAVAEGGATVHTSGRVGDGEPVVASTDPDLWLLRDVAFDAQGQPTHAFWAIEAVERQTLPVVAALNPLEPGYVNPHILHRYVVVSPAPLERIDTRVHLRPMGLDVLDEVIASGDLDPAFRARMPTFTFAPLVWTRAAAEPRLSPLGREALCVPRP